jgi:transposase-like protein
VLSDSPRFRATTPKRRAVNATTNRHWSDSQKIEAVQTFLLLGSIKQTARTLQIPEVTVLSWRKKEWWQELEKDLRTQENIVLSNKLKTIYEKALGETADRLENGDFVLNQKTGTLIRKPVGLRDAHRVVMDTIALKDKLTTHEQVVVAQENIHEKLAALALEFAKVADKIETKPAVEVTDVIFADAPDDRETPVDEVDEEGEDDAIYEEREEGLQEGE